MEMLLIKVVEKIKTHILYTISPPPQKIVQFVK